MHGSTVKPVCSPAALSIVKLPTRPCRSRSRRRSEVTHAEAVDQHVFDELLGGEAAKRVLKRAM